MTFNPTLPFYILCALLAIAIVAFSMCLIKKKYRKIRNIRRIAIVILLLIAMLRPGIGGGVAERDLSNLNLFFVVDNTGSMAAKDMKDASKYRYEVAAEDIQRIVELFPGAKYSIIALDYNIYQAMPLIDDASTAFFYARSLSPKTSALSADSDLSSLLASASERIQAYNDRYPDRKSLLFFLSDGENSNGTITVPSELSENIVGGAVIGYGTTNGVHVGEISYSKYDDKLVISSTSFLKERTKTGWKEHISQLNSTGLAAVADSLSISYYPRSKSDDKFNDVKNFASEAAIYHRSDKTADASQELYWLFIIVAIALLLWDFGFILDSLLLERKVAK